MKVCVYAIAKNEEKFAARWVASMAEADGIYVLDTGSTDNTVQVLRDLGVHVQKKTYDPWRFDAARNDSLALVPQDADLCVCTDLDEIFRPGWRACMEAACPDAPALLSYRYTWNFAPDGSEGTVFAIEKAHSRHGFFWKNPVHEVLCAREGLAVRRARAEGVQLDHHADEAKPRAQYLPLLELAVAEDPENDRNMHYLGREYMFARRWDECIATLKRHLRLKSAVWDAERSASMRFIARAWEAKGERVKAYGWLLRAAGEAPAYREAWVALAGLCCRMGEFDGAVHFAKKALAIQDRPLSYICEQEAWSFAPYDYAALGYYYTGRTAQAAEMAQKALECAPGDARLQENLRLMREKLADCPEAR